ncbi:PDDEXK nuclease domain-containing protein [Segatella copri]|uniref:PDDEXK nuclease domain-containing protein n=1 Tax=Segatella copri TaxID=165179 RepID=UPI00129231A8|nr:PDDEXK nuclease domain-containing protein [Segatella copri]MQN16265.1 DUF1016 domain-containing protein [Segatella copri]MQN20775.1 DUF1016 domain-containing protein [Segatella copri]
MEKNIINIDAHVIDDIRTIITRARNRAYQSINETLIRSNWEIGKRIVEEEQLGKQRADYGIQLIKSISQQLTTEFGSGYGVRNLAYFKQLYQYFPDWEILHARVQNLTWTHLRSILRVTDAEARLWYLKESSEQMWSTRTLDRNVASQYYYRLLQTSNEHKEEVENEMQTLTKGYADSPAMFIKSPMVTEFLGKGYAFVERQQHIITDTQDYYINLVFYNYLMKCFVLIDLKTTKITHQDVGQMDMYVRMYDELKRTEGDNPTICILLCSETSQDIARFSILHDSKQLFASKYLTYLPTEQQLKEEIEKQKEIFRLQHIR